MTSLDETPRGRIAANVRAELARKRLTNEDMGGVNGRSRSYWQRRTSGEVPFAAEELIMVAEFLDVPIDVLLVGVRVPAGKRFSHEYALFLKRNKVNRRRRRTHASFFRAAYRAA